MTKPATFQIKERSTCRICNGTNLMQYLDLGDQPPSNSFIRPEDAASESSFPLQIFLCQDCGLSQLIHVVSASDIFDDYAYLSSKSKALCNHYQHLVDYILNSYAVPDDALIVDIGCNDGIMLNRYPKNRFNLLGVEPSSAGAYAKKSGHTVIPEFFDERLGKQLAIEQGRARIITATNVFAHVDNIHTFARGVFEMLSDDGIFVIEFPYLDDLLEHVYFDTIYHEHLCYFALTPLMHLFDEIGLRAFHAIRINGGASGPAMRLFVCLQGAEFKTGQIIHDVLKEEQAWGVKSPERYRKFSLAAHDIKHRLMGLIRELKASGHKIGAYGAPAKGNTLLNFLGLSPAEIDAVAENNELKIGKLTPGSHIPIISDEVFMAAGMSHAVLLSWNYAEFFLKNSPFIQNGGKFIVPLPEPCIRP